MTENGFGNKNKLAAKILVGKSETRQTSLMLFICFEKQNVNDKQFVL